MTKERKELILALGSNYEQQENIERAQAELRRTIDHDIVFATPMWTRPIGIVSEKFLNCLAFCHTSLELKQVISTLKDIERTCGRREDERADDMIRIDIDLLKYGSTLMHERDWTRDYVTEMMKMCPF